MTQRESLLLGALVATALATAALWAGQVYLDEVARLDTRFSSLQKEAAQLQLRLAQNTEAVSSGEPPESRFWPPGALPDPVSLARTIKPVLDEAGIVVQDFQVATSTSQEFVLRYTFDSPAESAIRALLKVRGDPRLIVRQFSAALKEKSLYRFVWEVGYSTLP